MAALNSVGFISSGSLSNVLLQNLALNDFRVKLFQIPGDSSCKAFKHPNVVECTSANEAASGSSILFFVVSDIHQFESALNAALSVVIESSAIVVSGSFSSAYIKNLSDKLSGENKGLFLVHVIVSAESSSEVKLLVSGIDKALEKTKNVLSAMCKELTRIEGDITAVSKFLMVDKLLSGIHIVAAAEAMVLGASAGINTWDLYEIITHAAGSSSAFVGKVIQMLTEDYHESGSTIKTSADYLGSLLEEARALLFPLPLTAIAHQYFQMASSCGYGALADAGVVKVWEKVVGVKVTSPKSNPNSFVRKYEEIVKGAAKIQHIGFIGLGAMGFGMAATLVREKFEVCGFDVYEPTMKRFRDLGGSTASSAAETVKGAQVIIVMVANEIQVETVLFGPSGAIPAACNGSTVILCSTVSPSYVQRLETRLQAEGRGIRLVDAPVSGGVKKAADGALTIMAAGTQEALKHAGLVLSALSETLYVIDGGAGKGSGVKVVNQLLAGVHIAAAAEAMAFGARLGLNTRNLYQNISGSEGSSWMFVNRVPHMLDADYTPLSAVNIFVKDLGIVLGQGKACGVSLHLAATAHQKFLLAAAAGCGYEDDSAVVKIYEKLTGISVASLGDTMETKTELAYSFNPTKVPVASKSELLASLPPEWPEDPVDNIHNFEDSGKAKVLVVLDDDPTGTQTVHGVTVLTEWDVDAIKEEFMKGSNCFFILTNSRALSKEKAASLVQEIAKNVKDAATMTDILYTIVLRGDSTLRGHFPEEVDAALSVIGEVDAWIICPFFLQGGRYTVGDIHYVAEDEKLVPAGQTEFAKDRAFGYCSSNLKEWVEEKTKGRIKAEYVNSISIDTIRKGGPQAICKQLCGLSKGSVCIVNAASERDILVFSAGMIQAESRGIRFLCRTAAAFVSARLGIKYKPPVTPSDLGIFKSNKGALIVVGSYVPKTTKQVEELKVHCANFLHFLTVNVPLVASGSLASREAEITEIATAANALLDAGKDTVIMTSRELMIGKDDSDNLEINSKVSSALVEIVRRISVRPRYLLAKGGITSSDIATKAMRVKQAEVVGQALSGVPVWKLGKGSRHLDIPYIVFPGNVGSSTAVAEIVMKWASKCRQSAKDILIDAERGGYAVGAFNVYNLEGISAVVAAAEATKSSAILQIHPNALGHGKGPLVASCIAAAKNSKVPIAVHLDHGNNEEEIMQALDMGFDSIMVDFSHLPFNENLDCTKRITEAAHARNIIVEAELGRLSGTEDGLTVEEYEAKLTDPSQADEFLNQTKVDALAVCIGNVHGKYPPSGPKLNLGLLKELRNVASNHATVLVLHGASGLSADVVEECIKLGVRKFNVNTEVRSAYVSILKEDKKDLLDIMRSAEDAMQAVIKDKLSLFGSAGKCQ